jgi:hypothetical protein
LFAHTSGADVAELADALDSKSSFGTFSGSYDFLSKVRIFNTRLRDIHFACFALTGTKWHQMGKLLPIICQVAKGRVMRRNSEMIALI